MDSPPNSGPTIRQPLAMMVVRKSLSLHIGYENEFKDIQIASRVEHGAYKYFRLTLALRPRVCHAYGGLVWFGRAAGTMAAICTTAGQSVLNTHRSNNSITTTNLQIRK